MLDFIARHGVARWAVNFGSIILLAFLVFGLDARSADRDAKAAQQNADLQYQSRLDFCAEVELVRSYIRKAIIRGQKTLPTMAYYKEHPDELKTQLDNLKVDFAAVSPPLECPEFAAELTEGESDQ